ncbi:MAG: thiamine biosynthesis protein ThiJ, partial [Pontibacter sp.]|nr:thiamine biosynthesis protein ThiJ [Pontibacter sp.]
PSSYEQLKAYGATVITNKPLVTNGNTATAAGCLAAVDLVGWVTSKLYGEKAMERILASVLPIGEASNP